MGNGDCFLAGWRRFICAVLIVGAIGSQKEARAQLQGGQIQGIVTSQDSGKPLAGVTVVVSGPSMQQDQTEFTDAAGRYRITQLPPGDGYMVRFYFNDVTVERPGVRIAQNRTLTVSLPMPTQKGQRSVYVIKERAPNVDTASANTGVEIGQEILQNTAVRGRTFESVLALAPGASDVAGTRQTPGGDVGVSFAGSTGAENSYLIDGLNTTDPSLGLIGTELHPYFIKELSVITGGYQAEYGRATGGLVSIVTKSGSNEFHGSVFGSYAPFQLTPRTVARLGEALGVRRRQEQQSDFGFELGGPLIRDRLWFYVGFAPTFTTHRNERVVRTLRYDPGVVDPRTGMAVGGAMVDPDFSCPSYLATDGYCDGARVLALRTAEVPGRTLDLFEQERRYNWVAKLQFNLGPDHNITLGYIGAPKTYDGYYQNIRVDVGSAKYAETTSVHDATARYVGKLLDRRLQIEAMYGYHHQGVVEQPFITDRPAVSYRTRPSDPFSLADFEDVGECRRQAVMGPAGSATSFNPCPITTYRTGGIGATRTTMSRHVLLASATLFLRFLGNHAFKVGFDFEDNIHDNLRQSAGTDIDPTDPLSGHRSYTTSQDGTRLRSSEYAYRGLGGGPPIRLNAFPARTETRNFAAYLRDSWNVSFLPGLVVNAGLRWEAQEIMGADGTKQIAIYDNWSPRVGAVYDFTRKGRSKLFANYGRFYESVPMDINDRAFSGEGFIISGFTGDCATRALQPGGRAVLVPETAAGKPCTFPAGTLLGGTYAQVAPGLKGQFIDEISGGIQYDVGLDVVLGASYTHRRLGNIIEDLSTDGGNYYFIGNPGVAADEGRARELLEEVGRLEERAKAAPTDEQAQTDATNARSRLEGYRAVGSLFPRARRDYHALMLTATKRLSNRFSLLGSYTYSRTLGNYPGAFSPSNGQLDPNISSQYDLVDLLTNRNGPLGTDRPHNFKLTGYYVQPIGSKGQLTAGLTFTAISGRPIDVLGAHLYYGNNEVFILPRGSGGRTPAVTQFDLHLGYEHQLSKTVRLSVFGDAINLFNQREITNVDDLYTTSFVGALVNGRPEDLMRLRTSDGALPVLNSNYGQPTAFQAPLYLRFGGRLSF